MTSTRLDHTDDLTPVFLGRRIVAAEFDVMPLVPDPFYSELPPYGLLTLDDGTRVYVVGHDGGCACSSGCYVLTHLATVDNIITSVEVAEEPLEESLLGYADQRWQIFVYANDERLKVAEFEGSDGNGYYGTGFHLTIVHAGRDSS